MAVISFAHHKGGTGKTSSCLQVAGCLIKSGRRVLVIDTDPQANATLGLGIHPDTPGRTIYHMYTSFSSPDSEPIPLSDLIIRTMSGIDLVPSHLDVVGAEPALYQIPDRYEILSREIEPIKNRYDHILIDTPPFLGQFVLNGFIASDKNVLVFSPDSFAMNGYDNIRLILSDIEEILGKEISIDMAILNRWDRDPDSIHISEKISHIWRRWFAQDQNGQDDLKSQIEEKIRRDVRDVFIVPESRKIGYSNRSGMPLIFTDPMDPAAIAFMKIAGALDQR